MQVSKSILKLYEKYTNEKMPFEEYLRVLSEFNVRESLLCIAKMSNDIFWSVNDKDFRRSSTIKKSCKVEGAIYHQYGFAFAAYTLLISKATDYKSSVLNELDCLYLCNIYDIKFKHCDLKTIEGLEQWVTRLFNSRFRFEILEFADKLGKIIIVYFEIMASEIDNSSKYNELCEKFVQKYSFTPKQFFNVTFLLAFEAMHNSNLIDFDNMERGCLYELLPKKIYENVVQELKCDQKLFKKLNVEFNQNEEIYDEFVETRVNPLIIKPLIQTKKESSKYILVDYFLYFEKITQGLYQMFESIESKFRRKFYGPAIEEYCYRLLCDIYGRMNIVREFVYKNNDKFCDFSIIQDDKIYLIEIKSKTTTEEFNMTGNYKFKPLTEEIEGLIKQMKKFGDIDDSALKDVFKGKYGDDFTSKKVYKFMILDIDFISNKKVRKQYLSEELCNVEAETDTKFISINDLEEYHFFESDIPLEELYESIPDSDQTVELFTFKTVLLKNSEKKAKKRLTTQKFEEYTDNLILKE